MKLVKLNSVGEEVKFLRSLLGLPAGTVFDADTKAKVVAFQKAHGLDVDGIVGYRTWEAVLFQAARPMRGITDDDFWRAAKLLDCEPAALKAVQMVETGGKGGFLSNDKPAILFEGHIFWKQLKAAGINPATVAKGNEDILYEKWTKSHYAGGVKEYDRLERARKINRTAADASASWGMFQIMGFNCPACGEKTVAGFVDAMCRSEVDQLLLSARFIYGNKVMLEALQKRNWAAFAKAYNGAAYAQNQYDVKLAAAYKKCQSQLPRVK